MEKDQKLLIGLIAAILVVVIGIGVYLFVSSRNNDTDSIRFKKEYESYNNKKYEDTKKKYLKVKISEDNRYVYKTDEEIIDVLKNGTGVVFFGYAKCPYCRSMVSLLDEIAKENGIKKIYYVDILNIRDSYEVMEQTAVKITNGSTHYYEILDILDNHLSEYFIEDSKGVSYNTGVKRLYAPTVLVVKDGKILGFHEGTIEGVKYNANLSSNQREELRAIYEEMLQKLSPTVCSDKNC